MISLAFSFKFKQDIINFVCVYIVRNKTTVSNPTVAAEDTFSWIFKKLLVDDVWIDWTPVQVEVALLLLIRLVTMLIIYLFSKEK